MCIRDRFNVTPSIPKAGRFPFFVVVYMVYIIGYTCQCVVTKSAQSCLTNDPKQRPIFAMFDSVYNVVAVSYTHLDVYKRQPQQIH